VLVRRVSWVDCYTLMQISRMTFSLQTFPAFIPDAVLQERSVRFRTNRKHLTHLHLWLLSFHPVVSTYPAVLGCTGKSDKSVICEVGRRKSLIFFRTPSRRHPNCIRPRREGDELHRPSGLLRGRLRSCYAMVTDRRESEDSQDDDGRGTWKPL
jgi:hypothetical protein